MSNTSLLGSYGGLGNAGLQFRNRIINGNFDIWQRGTSQTSNGYGSDDRWVNEHSGNTTKTHSRQSWSLGNTEIPGNSSYYSRTVVTTGGAVNSYCLKVQKIESVRTFSGETATLSFWARADAPKNMAVEFAQNFGTGGSPSAFVSSIGVTTIALTTSWKYYTVTVTFPSIAGKTLGTDGNDNIYALFWFDAGTNFNSRTNSLGTQSGTFDIAQVQLEAGPVATPFEHRPFQQELALCQRYYELGAASFVWVGGYGALSVIYATHKRTTPDIVITSFANQVNKVSSINDGSSNLGTVTGVGKTAYGLYRIVVSGLTTNALYMCGYTANAEL